MKKPALYVGVGFLVLKLFLAFFVRGVFFALFAELF